MISTLKEQVEQCLKEVPETRNSDITLMIAVWSQFWPQRISPELTVRLMSLYDLPREDNIKRIRAKFNAEGKYWPTDLKIAKARGIQEDEWRVALGYPSVAATQTPTREESYTQQPAVAISSRPDPRQRELF